MNQLDLYIHVTADFEIPNHRHHSVLKKKKKPEKVCKFGQHGL